MFNLDPKKMQAMMKQMGIAQEEIPSEKVIIEKEDGGKIIVNEPSVVKIRVQGQDSFQISGIISEESASVEISSEDIRTVMEKTGCSEKQAKAALEKTGDLADAIMQLS